MVLIVPTDFRRFQGFQRASGNFRGFMAAQQNFRKVYGGQRGRSFKAFEIVSRLYDTFQRVSGDCMSFQ